LGVWQGPQLPLFATLPAFQVLPKRWVIERTNAWTDRHRRLAKDQDQRLDVAEAWIWFVHAALLMRRLAIC
jgi:putative transposase